MSDDVTVQILIEIRDEIRSTNQRLDQTNQQLDQTRTELRAEIALVRHDLGHEIRESELRSATRMIELTAATRDVYTMLTGQLALRDRVERCEHDIDDLKKRVG